MAPTQYKCRFCTFKTRHNKGLSSHYSQTQCGTKLVESSKCSHIKKQVRENVEEAWGSSPANSTDSNANTDDAPDMQYFSHHANPDIPAPLPPKRAHIKDVEDEGDISNGPERWVEDFPSPTGEPLHSRGSQETTFQHLRHEKMEKGEEMWAPFESRDEWDLVQWLMKAGVSQYEMEMFLQLGVVHTILSYRQIAS
ncbi:hypothetical protein EDD18DRAFT_1113172 [Armillaria luteobubalina]|uniref:Uncharacterized protein n=1 Tax=Armillaria luteobubalina TaxID=153913 RepID=A0AA39PCV5_9AGAR|nr:hypothetical protein EDD18DRAFT_1113172 [Armillaria luteobubalina]